MKFNKDMLGKNWIPYTVATCSAVVVYLLLSHIGNIWHGITVVFGFISPVFGGIILAYLIDALVVGQAPASRLSCGGDAAAPRLSGDAGFDSDPAVI